MGLFGLSGVKLTQYNELKEYNKELVEMSRKT